MDARIEKIFQVASRLFIERGYSKTQINHIAREAGISVGSVYSLFENKAAIFQFVFRRVINSEYLLDEMDLPIKEVPEKELEAEVNAVFVQEGEVFKHYLDVKSESYNFKQLLSDAFDLIRKYSITSLICEKNYYDCGALFNIYIDYRKHFFKVMFDYMNEFEEKGIIRKSEYPQYAVRFVIETLSWWGMHLPFDSFEREEVPAETAKKVAVETLCNAYLI